MYKFMGFGRSKGTMETENGGKFDYNNRLIRGYTDIVGGDDCGMANFEQKMKLTDLASCLGCNPTDEEVDAWLCGLLGSNIEFTFVPVKGQLKVNGFRVVPEAETPLKPMSEVVNGIHSTDKKATADINKSERMNK